MISLESLSKIVTALGIICLPTEEAYIRVWDMQWGSKGNAMFYGSIIGSDKYDRSEKPCLEDTQCEKKKYWDVARKLTKPTAVSNVVDFFLYKAFLVLYAITI
jgi:hypothetical protein